MEMAPRVTQGLISKFGAKEQVMLLDESIMAVHSLERSLMQLKRLSTIVGEILERQCRYHAPATSHRMTEVEPF